MIGEPTTVVVARMLDAEARQRAPDVRRAPRRPRDDAAHRTLPPLPRREAEVPPRAGR